MRNISQVLLAGVVVLLLAGCARDAGMVTTGLNSCEISRQKSIDLQQQLRSGLAPSRPAIFSSPTNARQSDPMKAMRAASAHDQQRKLLAVELKFQQTHCGE